MTRTRAILGLCVIALATCTSPADAKAPGSEMVWHVDPATGVVTATDLRGCASAEASVTIFVSAEQGNGSGTTGVASGEQAFPCSGETPNDAQVLLDDMIGRLHPGRAELTIGVVACYYDDPSQATTTCIGGGGTVDGRLIAVREG